MPWDTNADLPDSVQEALPPSAQSRFREVANDRMDAGASEASAIRQAWSVVGQGWEKPPSGEGKWVRKDQAEIFKTDDEQRMVWGWASVSTIKGALLLDTQADAIESEELVKMTTEFMEDVRTAKAMHDGGAIGAVVHSLPLTHELAKSLGFGDIDQEGWVVGMKVYDDDVWAQVKSGELSAFSIGGHAERVPIDE